MYDTKKTIIVLILIELYKNTHRLYKNQTVKVKQVQFLQTFNMSISTNNEMECNVHPKYGYRENCLDINTLWPS